jgi:hypothetical protein
VRAQLVALTRALGGLPTAPSPSGGGGSGGDKPDRTAAYREAVWRAAERGAGDRSAAVRAAAATALVGVVAAHGGGLGASGVPVEGIVEACKRVRTHPLPAADWE